MTPSPELAPLAGSGYYAVIFTSCHSGMVEGYEEMAERMANLAREQPGFLGIESARGNDGLGITISYWRSPGAIAAWKRHVDHAVAQARGRQDWYREYRVRVARVERDYGWRAES